MVAAAAEVSLAVDEGDGHLPGLRQVNEHRVGVPRRKAYPALRLAQDMLVRPETAASRSGKCLQDGDLDCADTAALAQRRTSLNRRRSFHASELAATTTSTHYPYSPASVRYRQACRRIDSILNSHVSQFRHRKNRP
jgi:hypothetical protein